MDIAGSAQLLPSNSPAQHCHESSHLEVVDVLLVLPRVGELLLPIPPVSRVRELLGLIID